MSIINKKQNRQNTSSSHRPTLPPPPDSTRPHPLPVHPIPPRNELIFHCQLAHGSPTKDIKDFANVKELYGRIAEAFGLNPDVIIFCTLNTHKLDMTRLLGGQIGLEDFIFAHIKGTPKTVSIIKQEISLGLTITDNGAGSAFIKRIKEGSTASKNPAISVGDMIESIDGQSLVGSKHYEVARMLKEFPRYAKFTMQLIEPMKAFMIAPRSKSRPVSQILEENPGSVDEGRSLRLKEDGVVIVQRNLSSWILKATERVDDLLESFMGIRDNELAHVMIDLAKDKETVDDFAMAIDSGSLAEFRFPNEFIINVWKIIESTQAGRTASKN